MSWDTVNRLMREWNDTIASIEAQCAQVAEGTTHCIKPLSSVPEVASMLAKAKSEYAQWVASVQRGINSGNDPQGSFTLSMMRGPQSASTQDLARLYEKYVVVPLTPDAARGAGVDWRPAVLAKGSNGLSTGAMLAIGLGVAGLAFMVSRRK